MKSKKTIIGFTVLIVLCCVAISSCSTNKTQSKEEQAKEEQAIENFKESASKTLNSYDNIKFDINKNLVSVVIDLNTWNATSETGRTDFMNEIYSLVRIDAITSGILDYHDVSVNFMTSDYKNVHPYKKIKKEEQNQ